MKQFREAMEEAEQGESINVNIFVGSQDNCDKLNEVTDLIEYLQSMHPAAKIETFVIPIPEDYNAANLLRRALITNVNSRFDAAFPDKDKMN